MTHKRSHAYRIAKSTTKKFTIPIAFYKAPRDDALCIDCGNPTSAKGLARCKNCEAKKWMREHPLA